MNKKYRNISQIYKSHAAGSDFDFSENALEEFYNYETYGIKCDILNNGYYVGKKFMDITITAWREDIQNGDTTKYELLSAYEKDSFEHQYYSKIMENWTAGKFFVLL